MPDGAVLLLRCAMLGEIGAFDPRFFLYFEETDLCRRASSAGWGIWAIGTAVADHLDAASAKSLQRRMFQTCIAEHYFRSRFYYLEKHFGWPAAVATEYRADVISSLVQPCE